MGCYCSMPLQLVGEGMSWGCWCYRWWWVMGDWIKKGHEIVLFSPFVCFDLPCFALCLIRCHWDILKETYCIWFFSCCYCYCLLVYLAGLLLVMCWLNTWLNRSNSILLLCSGCMQLFLFCFCFAIPLEVKLFWNSSTIQLNKYEYENDNI